MYINYTVRTYLLGVKLLGALISQSSVFLSLILSIRVLEHGLWENDTKSAGHLYVLSREGEEMFVERQVGIVVTDYPS